MSMHARREAVTRSLPALRIPNPASPSSLVERREAGERQAGLGAEFCYVLSATSYGMIQQLPSGYRSVVEKIEPRGL